MHAEGSTFFEEGALGRVLDILIVDDDPSQVQLVRTLLGELGLRHRTQFVFSGQAALDFLQRKAPFQGSVRPALVLLDLNMPGLNGCDVLRVLKADPDLRSIPVIMLSTSRSPQDVNACYAEHANAFLLKGKDLESNLVLLRDIDRFWGESVLLPG